VHESFHRNGGRALRLWMQSYPEAEEGSQNSEHSGGENARATRKVIACLA
jgi:hypothetical protein